MNKTISESLSYIEEIRDMSIPAGVQPFIIPPMSALSKVREALPTSSRFMLGAQNAHWAPEGAFTGEVNMRMAKDAGAKLIEVGHSERREMFGETDETVSLKTRAALDHDLIPLICVGESAQTRRDGGTEGFIKAQVSTALNHVNSHEMNRILIAYEPIWAIGEGGREPLMTEIAPVMQEIQAMITERSGAGGRATALYGGSVNLKNAPGLLAIPQVDGLFVGRSAWNSSGLQQLIALVAASL